MQSSAFRHSVGAWRQLGWPQRSHGADLSARQTAGGKRSLPRLPLRSSFLQRGNMSSTLTSAQIAFFHREGYLALDKFVEEDEIVWMREIYDRLFRDRAGRDAGDQFDLAGTDEEGKEAALPQILNPAKYAPELKQGRFRE